MEDFPELIDSEKLGGFVTGRLEEHTRSVVNLIENNENKLSIDETKK